MRLREGLLNPALIPLNVPRLFFYSMNDVLVPGAFVESHIADARKAGVTNITAKKDTSSHVSHMKDDPVGYWSAIKQLWVEGRRVQ